MVLASMALTSTATFAEAMLCTMLDAPDTVSMAGLQRVTLYHRPLWPPVISVFTDTFRASSVSKPSVSHAVKLLREGGFIVMDDDYTLHLTDLGCEIAEKLYERHQYFTEQLTGVGVDVTIAEAEACKMEHTISDESFQKLKVQEQKLCPFADTCDLKQGK